LCLRNGGERRTLLNIKAAMWRQLVGFRDTVCARSGTNGEENGFVERPNRGCMKDAERRSD
jgi:hypothetical protein